MISVLPLPSIHLKQYTSLYPDRPQNAPSADLLAPVEILEAVDMHSEQPSYCSGGSNLCITGTVDMPVAQAMHLWNMNSIGRRTG